MKKRGIYAVGHITDDLEPAPHLGGGVSYSAVAVKRLGFKAHIITKSPPDHPYLKQLMNLGIYVHRLPTKAPHLEQAITSFRNFYDEKGNRKQIVAEKQDDINQKDLPNFPDIPKDSIILIAPVVGEVDPEIFPELSKRGSLAVTPQGYFRSIEPGGKVSRKPWREVEALKYADVVILSDEDLTFDEQMDETYLNSIRKLCPVTVLTQGENGLTVFKDQEKPVRINPFRLDRNELKDFTGAGDSAAAAFIWHYSNWQNAREAGVFAALYPALKIMGIGGKEGGINSLPTLEQVQKYTLQNRERVGSFYRSNELEVPAFLERSRNSLERK